MGIKNRLATHIFKQAVSCRGLPARAWGLLRRWAVGLLGDPSCTMTIHGRDMQVNLSHELPVYQSRFPLYDALPRRLSAFMNRRRAGLKIVDVGANIGDSIAAFSASGTEEFLAVEPAPKFQGFLKANWGSSSRVRIVAAMCSSQDRLAGMAVVEKSGTAKLSTSPTATQIAECSLDALVSAHSFGPVDIIKIDTDGFDFDVITGARSTIAAHKPAVIFECDVFGCENYPQRVWDTLGTFQACGYEHFLVYDNCGYLIGRFGLVDREPFDLLLFYQLTGPLRYFDILVLPGREDDEFYFAEMDFFGERAEGAAKAGATSLALAAKRSDRASGRAVSQSLGHFKPGVSG